MAGKNSFSSGKMGTNHSGSGVHSRLSDGYVGGKNSRHVPYPPSNRSPHRLNHNAPSTSSGFVNNPVALISVNATDLRHNLQSTKTNISAAPASREHDSNKSSVTNMESQDTIAPSTSATGGPGTDTSDIHGSNNTSESDETRHCLLCKTKQPLDSQSYINHLVGRKHRVMEFGVKRSKQQKEERDRRTVHVSGFPSTTPPREICKLFFDLGMIDFHWGTYHAFVEFGSRAEAIAAIRSRIMFHGKQLTVAARTERTHTDDVARENVAELMLTPDMKQRLSTPCSSEAELLEVLRLLLQSIQLQPYEFQNRQRVRDRVTASLRPIFPAVSCHIFGSSANNLGFTGADVDLYADLGYDPYDTPRTADGGEAAAKLVGHLARHFRQQPGVRNVQAIPRARVPIVKFCIFDIAVDLSFRHAMPICNTNLIRFYTSAHPVVRPYMMLVRFWAKVHDVAGGGKPASLLTNYALTMMMAFVIMNRIEILPPLAQLRRMPYQMTVINGWNCGFREQLPPKYCQQKNYSVLELAMTFFDYYANLPASEWVICPLLGHLVSKKDMESKNRNRLPGLEDYCQANGSLQMDTPLCVQDPFDLNHNVTRGLTKIHLERFQTLCQKSSEIFRKIISLNLPPKALFDPIEISEDFDRDEVDATAGVNLPRAQENNRSGSPEPEVINLGSQEGKNTQDVEVLEISHLFSDSKEINPKPEVITLDPEEITLDADEITHVPEETTPRSEEITSSSEKITLAAEVDIIASNEVQLDPEEISRDHAGATQDTLLSLKRKRTHSIVSERNAKYSCSEVSLSDDDSAILTQIDLSGPYACKFSLPSDKAIVVDLETGSLRYDPSIASLDDVRWYNVQIIVFILRHVYAADVTSHFVVDESPNKKVKSCSTDSIKCIAKLTVTFKYKLLESRSSLGMTAPPDILSTKNPLIIEKTITDGIIGAASGTSTEITPFTVQFFACHRPQGSPELLFVANTAGLSENILARLRAFLCEFQGTTQRCLREIFNFVDGESLLIDLL
ncbi:uncharacterized protein LOC108674345 [Hyalella azteca]|uniref:Speckle targeted PIP5K1A-regulated poly(A) polymerase n=1 Tax=Hyalella azteca TaxID=294128 RepID=A0A8B7NVN0_HYAAZ|nr:uncharacterized protein LOC108674345 [Hyalella azteca]